MRGLGVRAAGTFGAAALLASLGLLASAFACSLIVGDSLAIVYCVPDGGAAVCGTGQICAPSVTGPEHMCVKPCSSTSQCSIGVCDHTLGWCVPEMADVMEVSPNDEGPSDSGVPEAPLDVVQVIDAEVGAPDAPPKCTGFGCPCAKISECSPKFVCVDRGILSEIDAGRTETFCASPCCTSGDCDPGDGGESASVCFATGGGGNYCVPTALLGDRSSIGSGPGGATCMGGPECRSGLCSDAGLCADTCCSTRTSVSACANQTVCRFDPFPGSGVDTHFTASCSLPPLGSYRIAGNMCMQSSDCQSGLCVDAGAGPFLGGYCEDPCRTAGDCNSVFRTCEYYQPDPMRADIVAACVPNGGIDAGVNVCFVDDPNSSNGDCQSGDYCRPQPNVMVGAMSYSVLACGM